MSSRFTVALSVLLLITFIAGCEGERGPVGPAGPEGPPGPNNLICYGVINNSSVISSWPSEVGIAITPVATGIWDVTLTGTFPDTEGTLLATVTDVNAARSITGYITDWSTSSVTFRVGIWNILDSEFEVGRYSFAILAEVE